MSKPPAFQLYAADFYMDTLSWDAETVGVYFRLLMHEWVNGYVPNDIDKIARISGMMVDRKWRANMQRIWRELCTKFVTLPDGNLVNVRMEETRNEQESYKEKLSLSGRLGGLRSQEIRKNKTSNPLTDPSSKASSENERLLTSTSLSINNNTIEKKPKKKFVIPTIEEITQYCKERKNQVNPQVWLDHYESNGWMVGKNKMNNWKAAVRTWEHRKFDDGGSYGRGKGNGDVGARVQPPIYDGDKDLPTEEERKRGLQRLAEIKKLAGGIG